MVQLTADDFLWKFIVPLDKLDSAVRFFIYLLLKLNSNQTATVWIFYFRHMGRFRVIGIYVYRRPEVKKNTPGLRKKLLFPDTAEVQGLPEILTKDTEYSP